MQLDLTRGDIRSHIKTLAVPACIGFLFHTLFNVTDTYFAGMISTQALAALSLSFPIFFIIISAADGMSEAVTALTGNALGAGDREGARHIAQNALLSGALLASVLTAAGYAVTPYLMRSLGAEGAYLAEALAYIDIIIYGTGLFVFAFFINALLNAVGTVWIGLASPSGVAARKLILSFQSRIMNKRIFAFAALELLRRQIISKPKETNRG